MYEPDTFWDSPRERKIALGAIALLLAGVMVGAGCWWLLHGAVNGPSLYNSVTRASGSPGDLLSVGKPACERRSPTRWRCAVVDHGGSGMASYRVVVTDGSCWRARRTADRGGGLPEQATGCVLRFRD